jgi:tetratricopeptide (TPR) repeat protein
VKHSEVEELLIQARGLSESPRISTALDEIAAQLAELRAVVPRDVTEQPGGGERDAIDPTDLLRPLSAVEDVLFSLEDESVSEPLRRTLDRIRDATGRLVEAVDKIRSAGLPEHLRSPMTTFVASMQDPLEGVRRNGDQQAVAEQLFTIGSIHDDLHQNGQALRCHREAAKIHGRLGNRGQRATNIHMMGVAYRHLQRYRDAIRCLKESIAAVEELSDAEYLPNLAMSRAELGIVCQQTGEFADAERCFEAASAMFQDLGSLEQAAHTRRLLAEVRTRLSRSGTPEAGGNAWLPVGPTPEKTEFITPALTIPAKETFQQQVRAFLREDYVACITAFKEISAYASLPVIQLAAIAAQRLGNLGVLDIFQGVVMTPGRIPEFDRQLFQITFGLIEEADVPVGGLQPDELCRLHYYVGARHRTMSGIDEARPHYQKCLALRVACVESMLAHFELW